MTAYFFNIPIVENNKNIPIFIEKYHFGEIFKSKILDSFEKVISFLSMFNVEQKFNLLLRGTEKGFDNFHSCCTNMFDILGNIVCIIRDTNGKIFGGYTDLNFHKTGRFNGEYKSGKKNSFIFILRDDNTISISKCVNEEKEIYCGKY